MEAAEQTQRGFLGHNKLLACPKIGRKASGILSLCGPDGRAPSFHLKRPGAEFSRTLLLKVGPLTSDTPSPELVRNAEPQASPQAP